MVRILDPIVQKFRVTIGPRLSSFGFQKAELEFPYVYARRNVIENSHARVV